MLPFEGKMKIFYSEVVVWKVEKALKQMKKYDEKLNKGRGGYD